MMSTTVGPGRQHPIPRYASAACHPSSRRRADSSDRPCRCASEARSTPGTPPAASTSSGSVSETSGSSAGKYREFSSNRSRTEWIHRSPNHTRGRTPWFLSSKVRVSVACSKIGMRDSCQSALPARKGELAGKRHLHSGQTLRGIPVRCEFFRRDAQVQLHGRTCRLRDYRIGVGPEGFPRRRRVARHLRRRVRCPLLARAKICSLSNS